MNTTAIAEKAPYIARNTHRGSVKYNPRFPVTIITGIPSKYKDETINPKRKGYGILATRAKVSNQKPTVRPPIV
jgi:hypothetical protein